MSHTETTIDVCIAGGGPAGLAAALALTNAGFEVVVVDCAVPPIDKACGDGLLPDSLAALERLGVTMPADLGFLVKGVRFSDTNSTVAANFRSGHGLGVRRTTLHETLMRHAERSGARAIWGAKSVHLSEGGVSINGKFLAARFVIGADGQKSQIREQAGLNHVKHELRRYGFRRHYRLAPWSEYIELYWGPRGQLYITPVASDEVCVAFISPDSKLRLAEALDDFPRIRERLKGCEHGSPEMGAVSVSRSLKRVYWDRLALLGDASGSVDAITGEGMCLAFKQASALACALKSGDLRRYQVQHARLSRRPRLMASLMLTMEQHPGLRRKALKSLAKKPQVFESLLQMHVGELSLLDLCSWRFVDFGVGLLAA